MSYCDTQTTASIDVLVPDVQTLIPGAGTAVATRALMLGASSVSRAAGLLEAEAFADTEKGVLGYELQVDGCYDIAEIKFIEIGGTILRPIPSDELSGGFHFYPPQYIELTEPPSDIGINALRAVVAVSLSADSCLVPKSTLDNFSDVIIHYALRHLYSMTDEPWYSVESAAFYGRLAFSGRKELSEAEQRKKSSGTVKYSNSRMVL